MKKQGKLIVIDGLDGSGKATQTKLLIKRLSSKGYKTAVTDFPRYYTSFFGKVVGRYLTGEFGKVNQVSPYLASILYALDRYEAKNKMEKWLAEGRIIVSNRYVSANQIHQTAKIKGKKEKEEFLNWLEKMEFKIFGIPKPNLIIFLNVPYKIGQRLVVKRGIRDYLNGKKDIHETSQSHLSSAQEQMLALIKDHTKWKQIDCFTNGRLLSKQEVADLVWERVKKIMG